MRRRLLQIALALVAVYVAACAGLFVAMRRPPRVFDRVMAKMPRPAFLVLPFRPMWMVARAGNLEVGDPAPDFSLETVDRKSRVELSSHRGQKPVVLVFGSYTWPPFRREVPALNKLYQQYKDQAAFYIVYIQEAHPSDGWQMASNVKSNVVFASPKSFEERTAVADVCVRKLAIQIPALIDDIQNSTEAAYTGWPDRLYVIDRDGRVAYKSAPGPFGFKLDGVREALQRLVPVSARPSGQTTTD